MKKISVFIFSILFLFGCSSSSATQDKLVCIAGDDQQSSILTYHLKKNKVSSIDLEMTANKSVFKGSAEEEYRIELEDMFSEVVSVKTTEDLVSFKVSVDKDSYETLKTLGVPFDQESTESSDLEGLKTFYDVKGDSCELIEA